MTRTQIRSWLTSASLGTQLIRIPALCSTGAPVGNRSSARFISAPVVAKITLVTSQKTAATLVQSVQGRAHVHRGHQRALRIYQLNPEWGNRPHFFVRNARDVTVYGFKNEGPNAMTVIAFRTLSTFLGMEAMLTQQRGKRCSTSNGRPIFGWPDCLTA